MAKKRQRQGKEEMKAQLTVCATQGKMKLTLGNRADTRTQTAKDWGAVGGAVQCAFLVSLHLDSG